MVDSHPTKIARSGVFYFLLATIAIVWLACAWLIWQNSSLADDFASGTKVIDSEQALDALPPLLTEPLKQVLLLNLRTADSDNALMIAVAREYQRRRPLDPRGWLWASEFHQRSGEIDLAIKNLQNAHLLARTNEHILTKVFNRYLALGLNTEALPIAHDLVYADPGKFRKLFYLLTRLSSEYAVVVDQVIPASVPTHREYPPNFYYRLALWDAIRAQNSELAKAVWNAIPSELKSNSDFGLAYLKYLANLQDREMVSRVWLDLTNRRAITNQIAQPNFEVDLRENSPCWEAREATGASWSLDANSHSGARSLMVEFNGDENINYHHLSCLVLVEPGKSYILNGMWSGRGISTLSGPFVNIYAPGVKGFYKNSEAMLGNWPWSPFNIEFTVPDEVGVIAIQIRRAKTDFLDSKISGKVWFDDFELLEVRPNTNIDEAEQTASPRV